MNARYAPIGPEKFHDFVCFTSSELPVRTGLPVTYRNYFDSLVVSGPMWTKLRVHA
jgi:hypothetical protein